MIGNDRQPPEQLLISKQQQQKTIEEIGSLLKEQRSLQQSLAKQDLANTASNEQLFLELLEIFDMLESSIDFFLKTDRVLTEREIQRLPKSLATIQSKLIATLGRRQVEKIEITDTILDSALCQVVDRQIDPDLTAPIVTKVVRQGFKIGDMLLRPVEVTIGSPG
jgi:molecular chaperone GrpE